MVLLLNIYGIFSFVSGYFILKEPASRLHSILYLRRQLENLISQGMPVNLEDWWYLVLQEAAFRQLVIINQIQKLLENGINQGLIIVFIDRLWTVQNELIEVKQGLKLLISDEILANECSWNHVLSKESQEQYYIKLMEFVRIERETEEVYPPPEHVFNWKKFCRVNCVKVVILGQDPYHAKGQAHGLSFSVPYGQAPPDSLINIFNALEKDGFKPPGQFETINCGGNREKKVWKGHGTLIGWAVQGVLLLNSVLTVREGKPNSHKNKGWEKFTDAVITWINNNLSGIVFMLWGVDARQKAALINDKKHKIIDSSHPATQSAYYSTEKCKSFMEVPHFSKCNKYLRKKGKTPIDWSWLPE